MRKIYQAVVVPQIPYGVTAWCNPTNDHIPAKAYNQVVKKFINIQK
jgi:hypothetical protein